MRENRKSGSEGGAGLIPRPDPYPIQDGCEKEIYQNVSLAYCPERC